MDRPPRSAPRRARWRWWRPVVGLALLATLFPVVNVGGVLGTLGEVRPGFVLLLLAVNTGAYLLFAARWAYFCRRLGLPLGFGGHLRGIYLFQLTSQVMPTPLLGEVGRFAAFPPTARRRDVLKSIALDRLSNQLALVACMTLCVPYYLTLDLPQPLAWALPVPAVATGAVLLAGRRLARPKWRARWPWLERLDFLHLVATGRFGLPPLLLGLALCGVLALEFQVAALALPLSVPVPATLVLLVPLLTLGLSLLPISMGDWGTRELIALAVLRTTGLSGDDVVAVSLLVGITNLVASLPGAWFLLRPQPPNADPRKDTKTAVE